MKVIRTWVSYMVHQWKTTIVVCLVFLFLIPVCSKCPWQRSLRDNGVDCMLMTVYLLKKRNTLHVRITARCISSYFTPLMEYWIPPTFLLIYSKDGKPIDVDNCILDLCGSRLEAIWVTLEIDVMVPSTWMEHCAKNIITGEVVICGNATHSTLVNHV